jgi:hypothetical protein
MVRGEPVIEAVEVQVRKDLTGQVADRQAA